MGDICTCEISNSSFCYWYLPMRSCIQLLPKFSLKAFDKMGAHCSNFYHICKDFICIHCCRQGASLASSKPYFKGFTDFHSSLSLHLSKPGLQSNKVESSIWLKFWLNCISGELKLKLVELIGSQFELKTESIVSNSI